MIGKKIKQNGYVFPIVGYIEWEKKVKYVWILTGKDDDGKEATELVQNKKLQFV